METYREPIVTVLGHIDVGKTSLLDKLRGTSVQKKEAGNITQKIGVTYFSNDVLDLSNVTFKIPGVLIIDTPGHDCFTSQRMCGVNVSDIVIVLIDIFKGLETQTVECLKLLKNKKVPFLVAANKLDRISEWVSTDDGRIVKGIANQVDYVKERLNKYLDNIIRQLAELEFNAEKCYKNNNFKEVVSIVPISTKTGEGIKDMMILINHLTTTFLKNKIRIKHDITTGFILEKMNDERNGEMYTMLLTDGKLKTNSNIVTYNKNNNIITVKIKHMYLPDNNEEIKDKLNLTNALGEIDAARSILVKFDGTDISTGTKFFQYDNQNDLTKYTERLLNKYGEPDHMREINFNPQGVHLVSHTKGMLDALVTMCETHKIDMANATVGKITEGYLKKIPQRINNNDSEDQKIYNRRYMIVLLFGDKIPTDIVAIAKRLNITILCNNIIYRIFEEYAKYISNLNKIIIEKHPHIQPICEMQILDEYVFRVSNPIIIGIKVLKNKLYKGQEIVGIDQLFPNSNKCYLGKIMSIQKNKISINVAEEGDEVCLKIDSKKEYNKDFHKLYKLTTFHKETDEQIINNFHDVFAPIIN